MRERSIEKERFRERGKGNKPQKGRNRDTEVQRKSEI